MKPHEETWRINDVIALRGDDGKRERDALAAAAPEMARALLRMKEWIELESEPERYPAYESICAALAKAGVIP